MQYLTIGYHGSRRVRFWEEVVMANGSEHQLLTFQQIANDDFSTIQQATTLRITSPGEDFETYKLLLFLGGYDAADSLEFDKGRIRFSRYWYKGWCVILDKIAVWLRQNPTVKAINSPAAIQLAFNKVQCQRHISYKVNTPRIFLNELGNYESFIQLFDALKLHQVFIKPWHGSSASGVMAFRKSGDKQILYTTIHLVQKEGIQLYNHLKLQKYTQPETIKIIINEMVQHGLMMEQWIRKKTFRHKSVDLRIVVIGGEAVFVVPRLSPHFITNLHLGNEKGKIETIEARWGTACIEAAKQLAIKAVAAIEGLFYAGVDVAIDTNEAPYILEVNAFGDMLLNINHENKTTYEWEFELWELYGYG